MLFRILSYALFCFKKLSEKLRTWYWRRFILMQGGEVGEDFRLLKGAFFSLEKGSKVKIGKGVTLAENTGVYVGPKGSLVLGSDVFIGRASTLGANLEITVGAGTQIAHQVTLIDTDHRFDQTEKPLLQQGQVTAPIHIGCQTWIGANAVILKGTTIGDHCVVGAGAIVTREVPSATVTVGNPGRSRLISN